VKGPSITEDYQKLRAWVCRSIWLLRFSSCRHYPSSSLM